MIYVWHHKSRSHLFWVSPKASRSAWFSSFNWFRRSRLVSYDFNVQTIWKNISGPKTCSEWFITCFISIKISHVYHMFSLLWLPKLHTLMPRLSHTFVCSRTASTTSANAVQTFVPSGRRHSFSWSLWDLASTIRKYFTSLVLYFGQSKRVQTTWLQELKKRCFGTEFQNQE